MSLRRVASVVGILQFFVGVAMAAAAGVALAFGDGDAIGIGLAAAITLGSGTLLHRFTRFDGELTHREGFAVVTLAWAAAAVFGALPYLLTGALPSPFLALFESMSGITATGATVIGDVESMPHGILFWRSLSQWLGGMGIIVLLVAVLSYLGSGGMHLFMVEAAGPAPERLRPRVTQTAKLLWLVYVGLTTLHAVLLMVGGVSVFEAVTHAFTTAATGGFSTRNASIGGFGSSYVEWVTLVFMYLGGISLALHYRAATGRPAYLRSSEWRFYTGMALLAGLTIAWVNAGGGEAWGDALRRGLFQSVAIITTTGYTAADYDLWGTGAQMALFALFLVGGMAGSTSGGIKVWRILLLAKHAANELRRYFHPKAVLLARVGGRPVKSEVLASVTGFIVLYFAILVLGAVALGMMGVDSLTAIAASVATVGNVGPGFGNVGALDNYGWMPPQALALLSFLMLVGRLEIYTVLLLLHREMWKGRRAFR